MKQLLFIVLILMISNISFGVELIELYKWKYVDYLWKDWMHRYNAITSGYYNASACILYDVDMAPDNRIFVTAVRVKGVPVSLMTISNREGRGGPLLSPYPSWSWYNNIDNNNTDCNNNIISVYRVDIKCNYIFVLDCGKIGEDAVCPPKLLIFDLENDKLVKRVIIPPHIANNKNGTGLLVTPLAYVPNCLRIEDATVFMSDTEGYGLVIYNRKGFCRVESDSMKPTDPVFTIGNDDFTLNDGILGLTIIGKDLYFAPLAGHKIFKIDIHNLMQKCSICTSKSCIVNISTQLVGTLSGQTAPIASTQNAIFFSNIPATSILCADATEEFNSSNSEIISYDTKKLQFISGVKVIRFRRLLMFMSNKFGRNQNGISNQNEINFRILLLYITQIREETNCFASRNHKPKPKLNERWYHTLWNSIFGKRE